MGRATAQMMPLFSRTAIDFIRTKLLQHISSRINILLLSDLLQATDSIKVNILLRFEHKRPQSAIGQKIDLHTVYGHITGQALIISPSRDTLDKQESICHFATQDLSSLAHQTLDFSLVDSQGNLLQKLLGDIGL